MKWSWPRWGERWKGELKRYQSVLLVMVVGALLLALPSGERKSGTEQAVAAGTERQFDLDSFEQKLAKALSEIEGAGQTRVVLTLKSGSRQILAQDVERDGQRSSASAVTVGKGSGTQEVIPLYTVAPQFQGALVVCSGGGDPAVRLRLSGAVSALTGLGSDRISICQGN